MGKRENGITMIALVITVIVLIIIAGISITALTGDDGLVKNTKETGKSAERESIIEKIEADLVNEKIKTGKKVSKSQLITMLNQNYGVVTNDILTTKDGGYTIPLKEIIGWEEKTE